MNIAFRVDATAQIGTGHFMRCLALADGLNQRGIRIRFVCRGLPEYLGNMLAAREYELVLLGSAQDKAAFDGLAHAHWLGCGQAEDANGAIKALSDEAWDWLVVDHYALDFRWESMLRNTSPKILAIDDIADRRHDCDVLLDQNYYEDMDTRYVGKVPEQCRLLLGPRYALLREEFRQLHGLAGLRKGPVRRILVFFGGMDANNFTGLAIGALGQIGLPDVHVDVVIGARHPCRAAIESECLRRNFTCHVQTDQMAGLMAAADMAIGAGGGAMWERCSVGLPTITLCTAENQRLQIAYAALAGLVYAPDINEGLQIVIERHARTLMENSPLRQLIARNALQAVDGRGVLRVVGGMGCGGVEIRAAKAKDSKNLFAWRNHPSIRAVSQKSGLISWEEHSNWFASVLDDPDRLLLIGQSDGMEVGVVRFDIRDHQAEVSIYRVPDDNNTVFGRELLQSAERWLISNRPEVNMLRAEVLGDNGRSQRLFLAAGYLANSIAYFKRLHQS